MMAAIYPRRTATRSYALQTRSSLTAGSPTRRTGTDYSGWLLRPHWDGRRSFGNMPDTGRLCGP